MRSRKTKIKSRSSVLIFLWIISIIALSSYFIFSNVSARYQEITPYCTTPIAIINHSQYSSSSNPDIYGRTMVYSFQGSLKFYDSGQDSRFGTADDLGIRMPAQFQRGNYSYSAPRIFKDDIVFIRSNFTSGQSDLMIYSLGPDLIIGTSDDRGPVPIISAPSQTFSTNQIYIDQNLVSFKIFNSLSFLVDTYYCTTDFPSGTCWNSIPQQIIQNMFRSNMVRNFIATKSVYDQAPLFFFQKQQSSFENLYFSEPGVSQEGPFYNIPANIYETLEDISFPFILTTFHTGQLDNKVRIGFTYQNSPYFQISPNNLEHSSYSIYDKFASISRVISSDRRYGLVSWIRKDSEDMLVDNYVISNVMIINGTLSSSGVEVIIPRNIVIPISPPKVYKDTAVFSDGNRIYISECFF
ncbi:MAG: hypothetical protein AABX23_00520 [Nanoarchaeota archaeon]